jgi:hypothetical protein
VNTTDTKSRRSLKFHYRGHKQSPAHVRTSSTLLPRDIFAGHPDTLAAYDEFTRTLESRDHHQREARRCSAEADEAAAAHRLKVRDALAKGKDASKISDKSGALKVQAEEHAQLAQRAGALAEAAGTRLGEQIAKAAPETFDHIDRALDTAAQAVREAQAQLDSAVTQWACQWQARRILSHAWLFGGGISNYDPTDVRPQELRAANIAIGELLTSLDELRADEQQILDQRAKDAAARRSLAAAVASNARPKGINA